MKNNIITYKDLKCPPKELQCILEDIFCEVLKNPKCLDVNINISDTNILTLIVGDKTKSVNLSPNIKASISSSFSNKNSNPSI